MKFTVVSGQVTRRKETILLWISEDVSVPQRALKWNAKIKKLAAKLRKEKRIKGKLGETFLLPVDSVWVVLTGIGKEKEFCPDQIRQAAAYGAQQALASGSETLAAELISTKKVSARQAAQAIAEGIALGTYRYQEMKAKTLTADSKRALKSVAFVVGSGRDLSQAKRGVREGELISSAVCWARDLANKPANRLTPTLMAQEAKSASRKFGFKCKVLEPAAIKRLGMNAFLGVAKGSVEPPRFIILEYKGRGAKNARPLVFVGKGITFDSGGISLKPSAKMEEMKFDMCGAAAVLGAVRAIAALKLPVYVVGLVAATENLPSGSAQKPGDVMRALTGKTIEVINTDAEGRLILADALGYAHRYKPEGMVDLATLTGACIVALGSQAMGLMGNHSGMIDQVLAASQRSAEKAWELPLWPVYSRAIRSNVADIQNVGDGKAGTITAGAFLKEFVEQIPWVHLDIAGVAWDSTRSYQPKGGTGVGVRLLVELAREWKPGLLKKTVRDKR